MQGKSSKIRKSPARSIRVRLLAISLGLAALAIIAITAVAINATRNVGLRAQQVASESLRSQARDYLLQLNTRSARENDLAIEKISSDMRKLAIVTAQIYAEKDKLSPETYFPVGTHMVVGEGGQYLNGMEDTSSVMVPNFVPVNDEVNRDVSIGAYLDSTLVAILKANKDVQAVYFATTNNVIRYYPNIGLGLAVPPDFAVTKRPWYLTAVDAANAARDVVWTEPYLDATGRGYIASAAVPVYTADGTLLGVGACDITLQTITSNVEAIQFLKTGYSFLMDKNGSALALPAAGLKDIMGLDKAPTEGSVVLKDTKTAFAPVIQKMLAGQSGLDSLQVNNQDYYVAYTSMASTGWSLGSVVKTSEVLQNMATLQQEVDRSAQNLLVSQVLPLSAGIFLILLMVGLVIISRSVTPIQKLASAVEQIGAGDWDAEIPVGNTNETIQLAQNFANLTQQLRGLIGSLEQRVAERTIDLTNRSRQLQAASSVSTAISTILDTQELTQQVVELIRENFGLYYVGLFLNDDKNEFALLQAGTGEAGKAMIARNHRIQIGSGMVGWTIANAKPRIALRAEADEVRVTNPDLPLTRSEAALPLRSRNRVLGALTVQSELPDAFDEAAVTVLQTMVDQVAVAIDNARLFAENQKALESMRRAYGELSRQAWNEFLKDRPDVIYTCDDSGLSVPSPAAAEKAAVPGRNGGKNGHADTEAVDLPILEIPIEVRGQILGLFAAHKNGRQPWTDEEVTLVQTLLAQLSTALESARLYEETQRRAERERLASDITARVRASNDPQTIMQTAVSELRKVLQARRAQVSIQTLDEKPAEKKKNDD